MLVKFFGRMSRVLAMPKTRKARLERFDFSTLDALIGSNESIKWQRSHATDDCSSYDFFGGYKRVFAKYRALFPARYDAYLNMSIPDIKKMVPRFPSSKCKQIVIGTGEDIVLYVAINNKYMAMKKSMPFVLFIPTVWDEDTNIIFTQCAISHQLNNCAGSHFIRILLPKERARLLDGAGTARITLREITAISKYVHDWNLSPRILKMAAAFDYDIVFI